MYINKYLIAFTFFLFSLLSFAQQETHLGDKKIGNQLQGQTTLYVTDPKFADIKKQTVFTSVNPNVSIHFGFVDDKNDPTQYTRIYSCEVKLTITAYDNSGIVTTSYKDANQPNTPNFSYPNQITLKVKHNNITKGLQFDDYAVYKLPGIHKAKVEVESITYYNEAGAVISVNNSSAYLELKFTTDRYYNLQLSSTQTSSVLPLEYKFIKYTGTQAEQVNNVSAGAEEILISWKKDAVAPAVEYELEWTWIDNFGLNGNKLTPADILLSDQDFKLNSTRIQTKDSIYRIPLVYSKGYIVYRVRPVGRFLDDISKNYYGNWTSGFAESHKTVNDWSPHYLEIDENHEKGKKNWQFQSSFAEDGKKKEVVSYFDGSLRNRQTVTKINSNNKAVVGEVIYDNQGRPAIEVLPVPVESSGIHFYPELNKNSQGTSIYTHNDFDWDSKTDATCDPAPVKEMSNTSGASKYYSDNNSASGNYQDLVPKANLLPFSQIEYTPDNTGRIKRKGGVGKDHQIGTGHEMRYFYGHPSQPELNRLFGYKVGDASRYKKNIVVDPNGQVSVSYLDPQGRTIATALAGDKKGNLVSLEDETNTSLHLLTTRDLLTNNDKYASGNNGTTEDGVHLNTTVDVIKQDTIKFTYGFKKPIGSYVDSCLNNKYYPFVYDWSVSMTNDCATELLYGISGATLSSKIGTFSISSYAPVALDFSNNLFEGKEKIDATNYKSLNIGTYNFNKNLEVDTQALNQYADDYIKELKNSTTCKPVIAQFEAVIQTTDCNVTCISCEEALVTSNLTTQANIDAYKSFLPSDQSTFGDKSGREPYIIIARTKYVSDNLDNLHNIQNTTFSSEETTIYTKHFETEFNALIASCRELCQQPVDLCNVNLETLLDDVSLNGQYGSIVGIEEETNSTATPSTETEEAEMDPLSVFNENNQLLYGGYKNTTITDPDNSNDDIIVKISKYNWRYPSDGSYKEGNGEISRVRIVKGEDGTYSPALRPLEDGTMPPTIDDPASDDENQLLAEPKYLDNVADFLAEWQPSWAKSLLAYHPEYQYYLYNSAICEKIDNGTNSDGFDDTLRNLEYYDTETNAVVPNNNIFTPDGKLSELLNITFPKDPFYTSANTIIGETSEEYDLRKNIMKEGLESNFDGMKFKNPQGLDVNMNMLQTAYYFAVFSNGIMRPSDYQAVLSKNNTDLVSYINSNSSDPLKQKIWSNFKNYYIALKEKTRTVFAHIYANKKQGNNDCIGNTNSTNSYTTLFRKYTDNFTAVTNLINASITTPLVVPAGFDGLELVCSDETAPYYINKEKRFIPADYSYDSGLSDQEALAAAEAKADANSFLETGKCPLAADMETFLKGLVDTAVQPDGLLVNTDASGMPYLTAGIFNAQVNPEFDISTASASPILIGKKEGNDLSIGFYLKTDGTEPIATPITLKFVSFNPADNSTYLNPCGNSVDKPQWADVTGFKNFHYISYDQAAKTFKFSILATIVRKNTTNTCTIPEEVIVEGYTKAAVGECYFSGGTGIGESLALADNQCTKKDLFGNALKDLVLDLQKNSTLTTTQDITNNDIFKTGNLKTYFGVNTGDVVKWNYETVSNERLFSITVNDTLRMKINAGDIALNIDNITDLFIGDLKAGGKSNILRLVTKRAIGQRFILDTRSWTITAGKNNALYFTCCGKCGENDFDGDGYGDICGDPNASTPGTTACQLNAQDEASYEENLKNVLNEIIINHPTHSKTADYAAVSYFITNSKLIEHYQALRNYHNNASGEIILPIDLSYWTPTIEPDNISISLYSGIYETPEAFIKINIPNANQIATFNSIDIIEDNSSAIRVNYTDINNQNFTITTELLNTGYTNTFGLITPPPSFCQFLANDYAAPNVVACTNYANDELIFENGLKNIINDFLLPGNHKFNPDYNSKTTIGRNETNYRYVSSNDTVSNFLEKNKIKERWNNMFTRIPKNFQAPILFDEYAISQNDNILQIDLNNYPYRGTTDNYCLGEFNMFVSLINLKKINSIDLQLDPSLPWNKININYQDINGNTIISEGEFYISVWQFRNSNGNWTGGALDLCEFFTYGEPIIQSKMSKNVALQNDSLEEITMDENGIINRYGNTFKTSSKFASTLELTPPSCSQLCVPPTVSPVICGDKWNEFKTGLQLQMPGYTLPVDLDGKFFCEANYGYISTDYLAYLRKFNVTNVQSPFFLSIAKFGATNLKYGNPETNAAINAYYAYIQLQNPNPQEGQEIEVQNWNDYANSYVTTNNICAPATMVPTFSIEVPLQEGVKTPCEIYKKAINDTNIQQISEAFYADKKEAFKQNYLKAALEGLDETLTQKSSDKEYQYTLYYYDQAGNLVQTVPPQGVDRLLSNDDVTINDIRKTQPENELNTANTLKIAPNHKMQTQYRYNSLNQLVWQQTPDGGVTRFAYDPLGRIIASQNAKQISNSQFSYTRYDGLGRITEAGQLKTKTGLALSINENGRLTDAGGNSISSDAVTKTINYPYNIADATEQVTKTIYDSPVKDTQSWFTAYGSDNSHKRVTAVLYFDTLASESPVSGYGNGIFYDYDVHGNVKELVHHINNPKLTSMDVAVKKVVYDYDLISGNVNRVTYQPNNSKDQFIHRYEYDADNRIQQVYTSKDNVIWEKEANYLYYDHGPLARVEIGDKQVQGLDYIYTLQGWLKGVNSEKLGSAYDAGKDGLSVAQDAFGFALNYYKGDYQSRSGAAKDNAVFSFSKGQTLELDTNNLFNGNIKEMVTSLTDNQQNPIPTQFNYYKYDQLNRIIDMTSKSITPSGTISNGYWSNYSYDRNGNLYNLNSSAPLNGIITPMDQLSYHYNTGNNQLRRVNDAVGNGVFTNGTANDTSLDIDNQTEDENYVYDNIGQLTQDKQEGINIDWRVDGKVKSVTKNNGTVISFEYDGLGNRIAKTVATSTKTTTTYYERDAQGNVLSTYEMIKQGNLTTYYLVEQDIYGSSRLGTEKRRIQISEDNATQLKKALSSKITASTETNALTAKTADENILSGILLDNITDKASWDEKQENTFNLFNSEKQQTSSIELTGHLKIDDGNTIDTTSLLASLHSTHIEGDMWPRGPARSYLNSVLLSVKKSATGYMPVVSLIKYRRTHHRYKKSRKKWRLSYRSYKYTTNYVINSPVIPENEWDIKAKIELNKALGEYIVTIIVNGNEYSTTATQVPNYDGPEEDSMQDDSPRLRIKLPQNTIGATTITHQPSETTTYNALKSEICDFGYTIDNGQEREDVLTNYFSLDKGVGQTETTSTSTTGHIMTLGTGTNFAQTYCGSNDDDKDGDGVKNTVDNCPNTFNPNQDDDDGDGVGNVCDNCRLKPNGIAQAALEGVGNQLDTDQDGIGDVCDNCKTFANFDQADTDVDENGAPKPDGIGDTCDNCRTIYNPNQEDINNNGIGDLCEGLAQGAGTNSFATTPLTAYRFVGDKQYELSNHLGNVLSVISDRSLYSHNLFRADVLSYSDYYPFGMLVPTRHGQSESYRYGFQGQEKDDEIKGEGNSLNYTYRMHDPRVGRFLSLDPLSVQYPHNSPYAFSENRVIDGVELEGLEFYHYSLKFNTDNTGKIAQTVISHDYTQNTVDWMVQSWEAGKMKKIADYPIYNKSYILNVNGSNFIFPTFSALSKSVKDGSWKNLEYGKNPTLLEAEEKLKAIFAKTDLAGGALVFVQGIKGFLSIFKNAKVIKAPVEESAVAITKFKLDQTFIKNVDNLVGNADIGWYTGTTAHYEVSAILKSGGSNASGEVFKNLISKMEKIARKEGMSEVMIEFKMVVNPRLKSDANWAREYGYFFSSEVDEVTGVTNVTWTKSLK